MSWLLSVIRNQVQPRLGIFLKFFYLCSPLQPQSSPETFLPVALLQNALNVSPETWVKLFAGSKGKWLWLSQARQKTYPGAIKWILFQNSKWRVRPKHSLVATWVEKQFWSESIWQIGTLLRWWEHSVSQFTCGSGYSPDIGMVCWVTELGDPEEAKEILPACNTIVTLDFYLFDHLNNSIHRWFLKAQRRVMFWPLLINC